MAGNQRDWAHLQYTANGEEPHPNGPEPGDEERHFAQLHDEQEIAFHNEQRARLADALGTNDLPDWYTVFQNINAWRTDLEDGDYEIGHIVSRLNLGDNVADFKNHLIIYANTFSTPQDPSDWVERVLPIIDQVVEQTDNGDYDNDVAGRNKRKLAKSRLQKLLRTRKSIRSHKRHNRKGYKPTRGKKTRGKKTRGKKTRGKKTHSKSKKTR